MRTVDFTGTVSHATMRPQDVLPACMSVLETFYPGKHLEIVNIIAIEIAFNGKTPLCNSHYDVVSPRAAQEWYNGLVAHSDCDETDCPFSDYWQSEFMSYILNEDIWNAMNEIAPEGYYFGAHPGNGSDYGYWRVEEEF